jgi:hypothetical protein
MGHVLPTFSSRIRMEQVCGFLSRRWQSLCYSAVNGINGKIGGKIIKITITFILILAVLPECEMMATETSPELGFRIEPVIIKI